MLNTPNHHYDFAKKVSEISNIKGHRQSLVIDLLPKQSETRWFSRDDDKRKLPMSMELNSVMKAMSLEDDKPINLPDEPRFRVFEENECSLLGRLLNPECQAMSRMIEEMPKHWRVVGRVRGIALSREKFQFIFKREEDLQTVLNDRPWSFNHWTMLLERWTESPPEDFLTKFAVWVRIRNIPCNFYMLDTMHMLAKAIGFVKEVAYDPKVSQKADFIRAQVIFDISKPARNEKVLNIPGGKSVYITYENEKLRKKCFHCLRLTHEKAQCPMLKKQHHAHRLPASAPKPPLSDTDKRKGKEVSTQETLFLEGPPGFPPMFPELSKEQQQSAMLYISHADPTDRRARIERVNQSIQEKREKELNYRPAFTTDLLKGAGMVLCYDKEGEQLQYIYSKGAESSPKTRSLPGQREIDEVSSGQSSTHSLNAGSPTGFCMGVLVSLLLQGL